MFLSCGIGNNPKKCYTICTSQQKETRCDDGKNFRAVSKGTGRGILQAAALLAAGVGARMFDVTADGVTDNTASATARPR